MNFQFEEIFVLFELQNLSNTIYTLSAYQMSIKKLGSF
jgi:hypothetical protein